MDLKPSYIFYSQDSINNVFDKRTSHNRTRIGETLDDVCEGRCQLSSIPTITVVKRDGKWVTADNRRLWVFRELERLGKCDTIPVRISAYIPEAKLTTYNGGTSVRVRGPAGGYWHNKPTPYKPTVQSTLQISNKPSAYQSGYKVKDLSERPALFSYQAPSVYKAPTMKPQSSIPTHMTNATKTNVAMTAKTSPENSPTLTIRSTSDSFRTNPLSSDLQATYKAPVKITPISYSSSKYPSFSDIGKANDDYSQRHTHSSLSPNRDHSSCSKQVGSSGSHYRDQNSNSKESGLSVLQDRVPHSNYSTEGASSGSQYRNQLSNYAKQGSPSRPTVSRSDSSVDHSSVRATEHASNRDQLSNYSKQGSPSRPTVSKSDTSVDHNSVRATEHASNASEPRYVMPSYREGSRPTVSRSDSSVDHSSVRATKHASNASEPRYVMPTYREGSRPNNGDSNQSCCGCTIL